MLTALPRLLVCLQLLMGASVVHAQTAPATATPDAGSTELAEALDGLITKAETGVELVIYNRTILVLQTEVSGITSEARAENIRNMVAPFIESGRKVQITIEETLFGPEIEINGAHILTILEHDTLPDFGGEPLELAEAVKLNLAEAINAAHRSNRPAAIVRGLIHAGIATVVFALLVLVGNLLQRFTRKRACRWLENKMARIRIFGRRFPPVRVDLIVDKAGAVIWSLVLLMLTYAWITACLAAFPQTEAISEKFSDIILETVTDVGMGLVSALPDLFTVLVIIGIVMLLNRILRFIFGAIERGDVEVPWLHDDTAVPTRRLCIIVVWIFGFVLAYPYLPGSNSEAFKAVGVFAGLLISLGSSGLVGQAMAGLNLMYSRAYKQGDHIRCGDIEGKVLTLGVLSTKIRTLVNEEVTMPNGRIMNAEIINFSRPNELGYNIKAVISIGYDTPWRQVHALCEEACAGLEGRKEETPIRILQTALLDYAVEYTIIVPIEKASIRKAVLSELHANIQDAFNRAEVAIMSPHYVADTPDDKLVPESAWYTPPAKPKPEGG